MFEDVTHNISQNLEARKLYEQVVSSHPSSAEAHLRLAEFAQEADDAQEAYRIALQAVKVAPRDAAAHLSLGHASSKLGRPHHPTSFADLQTCGNLSQDKRTGLFDVY
ncbi:unnamed protein product [Durusdinium trenchii]|uniref:Uncharacterized protein n=1 Tax=Durusdinium trenchii TaxID=1381693 RepID=A0ABP0SZY1_9DINO